MSEEHVVKKEGMTVDEFEALKKKKGTSVDLKELLQVKAQMEAGELVGQVDAVRRLAARTAHEVNRAYCESLGDHSQVHWNDAPDDIKASKIAGVKLIESRRSDPAKHFQPMLPNVLHAFWCRYKKEQGWAYGDVKDAEKKTHPCLVPFSSLSSEQQLKAVLFQAAVRGVLGI